MLQAVCVLLAAAAFDARPWLDDLRQLTSEISAHYANLDWAVEHRRMDLPKLRDGTEARLRAATSEQEARAALQRFVDVFGDGHLTIEWPKPDAPSATPPASSLCARLGYRRPSSPGVDFSQVAGFTPLGAEPFPHGLLRLGRRTVGVLRIALPGAFAGLASRTTLFHPLLYAYRESADRLPLYVIVDRHTWSAAEYFAAILQDNRAAVVAGELTGGAGCGYTDGGIPAVLANSGAKVRMPDCVRLRKDGSDEVAGVTPDVLVPWAEWESPFTKADKLVRALIREEAKLRKPGQE